MPKPVAEKSDNISNLKLQLTIPNSSLTGDGASNLFGEMLSRSKNDFIKNNHQYDRTTKPKQIDDTDVSDFSTQSKILQPNVNQDFINVQPNSTLIHSEKSKTKKEDKDFKDEKIESTDVKKKTNKTDDENNVEVNNNQDIAKIDDDTDIQPVPNQCDTNEISDIDEVSNTNIVEGETNIKNKISEPLKNITTQQDCKTETTHIQNTDINSDQDTISASKLATNDEGQLNTAIINSDTVINKNEKTSTIKESQTTDNLNDTTNNDELSIDIVTSEKNSDDDSQEKSTEDSQDTSIDETAEESNSNENNQTADDISETVKKSETHKKSLHDNITKDSKIEIDNKINNLNQLEVKPSKNTSKNLNKIKVTEVKSATAKAEFNSQITAKIDQNLQTQKPQSTVKMANQQAMINRITSNVKLMVGRQQSSIRMDLDPPELGKMQVRLTVKDSNLIGHLRVESVEAKDIINRNLDTLKNSLEKEGLAITNFQVDVDAGKSGNHWQNQYRDNQNMADNAPGSLIISETFTEISDENIMTQDRLNLIV